MEENAAGPSTPPEPPVVVNVQKPLNNSSVTQGFIAVISLLPCVISGAILGFTGVSMWNFPLTYRNSTWFASLAALGAAVGCLISHSLMNAFGPRGSVLLSHVVCAIGWMLTFSSWTTSNLLVGRTLTGVFVGIVSVAATAHSSECFPSRPAARPVVYTAIGVLCVYLAGSLLSYAQTAVVFTVATIVSFIFVRAFVPESPAWLESRGRTGDAEYSRLKLRVQRPADARSVEDGVEPSTGDRSAAADAIYRRLHHPDVYRPLLALGLHLALQQMSGPLVLVSYATQMVDDSGVRVLNSHFVAAVLAAFLVAGALVSTAMNHRESSATLAAAGTLTAGVVIAIYNLARRLFLNRLGSQLLSFIPLLGLIVFSMSSSVGMVPHSPVVRYAVGEHVALAFGYTVAFAVIKCYPYVHAAVGWWVFAVFAVASALNIVYGVLMFSEPEPSKQQRNTAATKRSSVGPAV
ncbi:facilitated trehalose transporter Tret1-like isoform X1 [Rhopalosiphum maidis]|uniref:facilitated trehalose transporter Tret1-like isoform X1 n=2 Tax=Rhopalosiphum maidis TaxID=43146 RepID=UPI000EFEDD4B|nr:facilitated trehalose transporter Tret1-like isoform X1 [Rhopalosiphum maidis]